MALTITKAETAYTSTAIGLATHTLTTGFNDFVITDADDKKISEYVTMPSTMLARYNTSAGGRNALSDYVTLDFYIGSTYLMWVRYDNMVKTSSTSWSRYAQVVGANTNVAVPLDASNGTGYSWGTYRASRFFNASNKTVSSVPITVRADSGRVQTGTYSSGGFTGASAYGTFSSEVVGTINLKLNVPPTFDATALSYTAPAYTGITTASVTVSNCTAYYGGDISSASLTIGTQTETISGNGTISMLLNEGGTFTPKVTVTDSRGQKKVTELDPLTVNVYNAPSATFTAQRTTQAGVVDDEGTYAVISTTLTFDDAIATALAPTVTVMDEGGTTTTPTVTWHTTRALTNTVTWANVASGDTVYGLVSGFNTQYSYEISVTPRDDMGTGSAITQTLASAFYTVDFLAGGHGIAFGQPARQEGFYCNMEANFIQDINIDISDYQTAGTTDKAIYDAITALGWDSDVLIGD